MDHTVNFDPFRYRLEAFMRKILGLSPENVENFCQECDITSKLKTNLRRHMSLVHAVLPSEGEESASKSEDGAV